MFVNILLKVVYRILIRGRAKCTQQFYTFLVISDTALKTYRWEFELQQQIEQYLLAGSGYILLNVLRGKMANFIYLGRL